MSDFEPGMPPPPFEHRDSVQDLIDFEEAQCSGGERKLFVRWMEEDSAKVAKAREKKSAADEKAASAKQFQDLADNVASLKEGAEMSAKFWLTKEEAAQYLGVSTRTIDRTRRDGKLKYHLLDGTTTMRFKVEDLDALMK
jgi:excisionase family DNA binding protein